MCNYNLVYRGRSGLVNVLFHLWTVSVVVTLRRVLEMRLFRISAEASAIPTDVFRDFHQSLQANTGIVS
jgi:hypothetical protein